MECTSCHDVHNAQNNRPFIATVAFPVLCTTCHTGRTQTLYGSANALGTHPVDNVGTVTGDMAQNGANPIVAGMDEETLVVGTGASTDNPWNSGGHLVAGGDFSSEGSTILDLRWGVVSIVDIYVGAAVVGTWIWWRDGPRAGIFWVVALVALGHLATAGYVAWRAWSADSVRTLLVGDQSPG